MIKFVIDRYILISWQTEYDQLTVMGINAFFLVKLKKKRKKYLTCQHIKNYKYIYIYMEGSSTMRAIKSPVKYAINY